MDSLDEKSLFLAALELPASEREEFLRRSSSEVVAKRVLELISHHDHSETTLARNAPDSPFGPVHISDIPDHIDEFQIIRVLGHGGMGVVYLAQDLVLDRLVALKIISSSRLGSDSAGEHLWREAQSVARLSHPGIVAIYKLGEHGGDRYIVSEYVDGPSLRNKIDSRKPDERQSTADLAHWIRWIVTVFSEVASALEYCHVSGVVHCDVKPSNILIDAHDHAKLTDFGIAQNVRFDSDSPSYFHGSMYYMSPEQAIANKNSIDQRSDIFSLGVCLYEALTLQRPFIGETPGDVLNAIIRISPVRPRAICRRIPRDLEVICEKCLEKSPQHRYQSAAHVAADLRCFLSSQPILARAPSIPRRAAFWIRRHQRAVLLGVTALSIGIASTTVILLESNRRKQVSTLDIISVPQGATVTISSVSLVSDLIHFDTASTTTSKSILVPPGYYRITVIRSDGDRVESDVYLPKAQEHLSVDLSAAVSSSDTSDMARIPGGQYHVGPDTAATEGDRPRQVTLSAYYIDRTEVSNEQYLEFTEATNAPLPSHLTSEAIRSDRSIATRPITGISWQQANAYARWRGKRLPTSDEWEVAMRFPDNRLNPWGDREPPPPRISSLEERDRADQYLSSEKYGFQAYFQGTVPVESEPESATPLGIMHGSTNVSEYTSTAFLSTNQVVIKGSDWLHSPRYVNLTSIQTLPISISISGSPAQQVRSIKTGFRCMRPASP